MACERCRSQPRVTQRREGVSIAAGDCLPPQSPHASMGLRSAALDLFLLILQSLSVPRVSSFFFFFPAARAIRNHGTACTLAAAELELQGPAGRTRSAAETAEVQRLSAKFRARAWCSNMCERSGQLGRPRGRPCGGGGGGVTAGHAGMGAQPMGVGVGGLRAAESADRQ